MNRAELRLVSGDAVSLAPEAQLRALFRRQKALKDELQLVDLDIAIERRRYADKHGLITPPRLEQLRAEFGQ